MRISYVVLCVGVMGCESLAPPGTTQLEQAIKGGTVDVDGGFSQTVMVRARFNPSGQQALCSGTLITSRVVLTAAHCFDPAAGPSGSTALAEVFITNVSPDPGSSSPLWRRVDPSNTRLHPMWSASDVVSYDLALAALPADAGYDNVTPAPPQHVALTAAEVGRPLKVVGFGQTAFTATDSRIRRWVDLPLRGLTAKHLQIGDSSTKGICNGDSGGPSFLRGRDGVYRVAGVHSYDSSRPNCDDGLDTRVDLFTGFVQQFIRDTHGGPSCLEDGQCATGCASVDVDCVCQADGVCNGACPNLLTDPDCPADCVQNDVCATVDCPRLDPDCHAELSTCTLPGECQYRQCASDVQRGQSYCSRPCSATCMAGTECVSGVCLKPQKPTAAEGQSCDVANTFCLDGTQCTALVGQPLACLRTCATNAQCLNGAECVAGQGGQRVCQPTALPGASCSVGITKCLENTQCTAFDGEPLTCRLTCQQDMDCAANEQCDVAQGGFALCTLRPISLPLAPSETGAVAKGCSSVPVLGPLLALGLLAARRRRQE